MARTSCRCSAVVWTSDPTVLSNANGRATRCGSQGSIVPFPSASYALPGAANVRERPPVSPTVIVVRGPPPCPIALSEMTAIPCDARTAAVEKQKFLVMKDPCAQTATGHPPDGLAPDGSHRSNATVIEPVAESAPVREALR